MKQKILVTGGCGFIGHHLVQHLIVNTDWDIVIIDKLSYASNGLERLREMGYLSHPRIKMFTWDLATKLSDGLIKEIGEVDIIAHLAAETHVDNSISDPVLFIQNNVMSTTYLLEYARTLKTLKRFLCFSTDEVYGPALNDTLYTEDDRHNPKNPYSASKACAENICVAYENTYKVPVMIINAMNVIGERQLSEKFLPLAMKKILAGETIFIHTDKNRVPGSRFYIHARNVADAVLHILKVGEIGQCYNIAGEQEVNNLELVQMIAEIMGKELKYELIDFHSTRPGHDLRYGLNGSKLAELGWSPPKTFRESLSKTVLWTLQHPQWL
jgi:dTDP-glucose 4,6-dehydratase